MSDAIAPEIGFDDFMKVDIRTGTIVEVRPFPEARKPAHIMLIDFGGEIGVKKIVSANYSALPSRRFGGQAGYGRR